MRRVIVSERFSRTELLIGTENLKRLKCARIAVFGVGGVGGYVVEALARSGIGTLELIDDDIVSRSNINRQIITPEKTVGRAEVDVAKGRLLGGNSSIDFHLH